MKNDKFSKKYRNYSCLNCQTPLDIEDRYCHHCGQLNSNRRLSFNNFLTEFLGGIFSYDSRIYRTLSVLIFNPGQISLEYIKGKRTKYANPYRFYLSISIIFFLLYGIENQKTENIIEPPNWEKIYNTKEAKQNTENHTKPLTEEELSKFSFTKIAFKKIEIYFKYKIAHPEITIQKSLENLDHTNNSYNRWLFKRAIAIKNITENPLIFFNYIISKLPFVIFFFIPVFTLVLWLTYGRTHYTYMEHLVFTFHTQTMLFFMMSCSIIINFLINKDFVTTLFILGYAFYLFTALRKFYNQGALKTLIKFVFLNLIFTILAITTTSFAVIAFLAFY